MRVDTYLQQINGLTILGHPLPKAGGNEPSTVNTTTDVQDFYHVGLWNYCSGTFKNETAFDNKEASKTGDVANCTNRAAFFWFSPVEVWDLNQTVVNVEFGEGLRNTLGAYPKVTKGIYTA